MWNVKGKGKGKGRQTESNAFQIKAVILDSSPLDLIIGRLSIEKCGPVLQIPSEFEII